MSESQERDSSQSIVQPQELGCSFGVSYSRSVQKKKKTQGKAKDGISTVRHMYDFKLNKGYIFILVVSKRLLNSDASAN